YGLVRDYLDDVTITHLVTERDLLTVGPHLVTVISDLGVNAVREVERRRTTREHSQFTLRSEYEHFVGKEVALDYLEELRRIFEIALKGLELSQPGVTRRTARSTARSKRRPLGYHALFGYLMHLVGTDLNLDAQAPRPHHSGVERLITIGLRQRDVVFEAARDRGPFRVDRTERRVAVRDRLHAYLERYQIVDLVERALQGAHAAVDAGDVSRSTVNLTREPAFVQEVADRLGDAVDVLVTFTLPLSHAF